MSIKMETIFRLQCDKCQVDLTDECEPELPDGWTSEQATGLHFCEECSRERDCPRSSSCSSCLKDDCTGNCCIKCGLRRGIEYKGWGDGGTWCIECLARGKTRAEARSALEALGIVIATGVECELAARESLWIPPEEGVIFLRLAVALIRFDLWVLAYEPPALRGVPQWERLKVLVMELVKFRSDRMRSSGNRSD